MVVLVVLVVLVMLVVPVVLMVLTSFLFLFCVCGICVRSVHYQLPSIIKFVLVDVFFGVDQCDAQRVHRVGRAEPRLAPRAFQLQLRHQLVHGPVVWDEVCRQQTMVQCAQT